jgi:hypothetical protein
LVGRRHREICSGEASAGSREGRKAVGRWLRTKSLRRGATDRRFLRPPPFEVTDLVGGELTAIRRGISLEEDVSEERLVAVDAVQSWDGIVGDGSRENALKSDGKKAQSARLPRGPSQQSPVLRGAPCLRLRERPQEIQASRSPSAADFASEGDKTKLTRLNQLRVGPLRFRPK